MARDELRWADVSLDREVGRGKAGTVWRGYLKRNWCELLAGAVVAVKRYEPWVLSQSRQEDRIIRELQVGLRLDHPNIVKTHALIRDPNGCPALVMEFLEGQTLESLLSDYRATRQSMSVELAFSTVTGLFSAVYALNDRKLIHRDIKPANVMVCQDRPVLMDLGVVTRPWTDVTHSWSTAQNQFLGTIRYAAPEYLFGESYGPGVDVFSIGAIIWELFSNSEYDQRVENWAQLIALRHDRYSGPGWRRRVEPDPEVCKLCNEVAVRSGVLAAEALYFLLDGSLANPAHRLTPQTALAALHDQFWTMPFYVDDQNRVICATPPGLSGPHADDWGSWRSLDDHASRLTLLAKDELEFLKLLLKERYFDDLFSLPEDLRASADALGRHGVLYDNDLAWPHTQYWLNPVVKMLFVYGRIG